MNYNTIYTFSTEKINKSNTIYKKANSAFFQRIKTVVQFDHQLLLPQL